MADYKRMYYHMIEVTEDVIRTLIAAQQQTENIYIQSSEIEENTLQIIESDSE